MTEDVRRVVEAVWRMESAKIVGALARMFGQLDLAEEVAHDAVVAALESWPKTGLPDQPAAWLMTVAKRGALDRLRRDKVLAQKHQVLGSISPSPDGSVPDVLEVGHGDDVLSLMFIACHPILSPEAQMALTLRLVGGLSVDEIARAYLVTPGAIAQRIVRAKRVLASASVPFETPSAEQLGSRLSSVLEVLYLIFNEGYSATAGQDLMRPELCEDALRLGRMLAGLAPTQPEVHALVALMEIQSSRRPTRVGPDGELVPLLQQDRSRWDQVLIHRGLAAFARVEQLPGPLGPYALQAAIAICHARARTAEQTDWVRIAALYEALAQSRPSPIVELNRAVAVGKAYGAAAGLEVLERLTSVASLANYHLLPAVRGDFLAELGRHHEAAGEFERAASLTANQKEREFLIGRSRHASQGGS